VSGEQAIGDGKDPLSAEHLRSIIGFALGGALIIYVASVVQVWGDWPRVAAIAVVCVTAMMFNWGVTASLIPRVGVERAEDLRIIPNIIAMVGTGIATHWSVIALLFLPFSAALVHGLHTRRPTIRLAVTIGSTAIVAFVDGADPLLLAGMLGLTAFWHVVAIGKIDFARSILSERQRNLTELATAHKELIAAQQHSIANEKLASIGMLASGIAHEINNPMSFITANVKALLQDLRDEPLLSKVMAEYRADVIPSTMDGIRRVNAIVDDLRRFARGEPETAVPFDLATELNAAVRIARSQLRSGQVLHADFKQPSPALCGMPRQISQVALNLIVNAIQASPDDGEVFVSAGSSNGEAVFRVRDNGSGIAPDVLERLFTPFVTTKAAGMGTGLGLAVAHGMVKAHGGRIVVSSDVGAGTMFEVFLPASLA
jgi:two-component system NtrC family sensor kinase